MGGVSVSHDLLLRNIIAGTKYMYLRIASEVLMPWSVELYWFQ